MSATAKEATNFFEHCLVAARLVDEFKVTTVTKGYVVRAVRMATVCSVGKGGVQYASDKAQAEKAIQEKPWEKCGLIKEHVVPVSLICAQVRNALRTTRDKSQAATPLMLGDQDRLGLTPEVIELFVQNPRAWEVARIIREWTLLAWITEEENKRFDEKDRHGGKSIRKCMPKGWKIDQDRFARYVNCKINLSKI